MSSPADASGRGPTPDARDHPSRLASLARATLPELAAALAALREEAGDGLPEARPARGPETGLVMLTGRIGGDGAPFNLGEATVTRASVALSDGRLGHCWRLGRGLEEARLGATLDALALDPAIARRLDALLFAPVAERLAAAHAAERAEAAATRVDFFTLVRGEP